MATVTTQLLTAEEFHDLPDPPDGKLELVRGEIVRHPWSGMSHGERQDPSVLRSRIFCEPIPSAGPLSGVGSSPNGIPIPCEAPM